MKILLIWFFLILLYTPLLSQDRVDTTDLDSLKTRAEALYRKGDYSTAANYAETIVQVAEKKYGKTDTTYATWVNNLALLRKYMSQYERALSLYQEAVAIAKKTVGKNHTDYKARVHNLAGLYLTIGQYDKARKFYKKALRLAKTIYNKNHPEYARSLNGLAQLKVNMGLDGKSLPLFKRAKEIIETHLGQAHPMYGIVLNNLASTHKNLGHHDKALALYKQSLAHAKEHLGKSHPDYGNRLNHLAVLHQKMGHENKAESLFLEALQNTRKNMGKGYEKYQDRLNSLSGFYHQTGQFDRALTYFQKARTNILTRIDRMFSFLSDEEKTNFLKRMNDNFDQFRSFTAAVHDSLPQTTQIAYNNQLLFKGLVLSRSRDMRETIRQHGDSTLMATYDEWKKLRTYLAQQYARPKTQRASAMDSLESEATKLERKLVQQSDRFREEFDKQRIQWQQIRDTLQKGEAAIEFLTYRPWSNYEFTDTTVYAALLLRKGADHPEFISLFKERELKSLLQKEDEQEELAYINTLYGKDGKGQKLYELLWSKIEPQLTNMETVYYSPAGKLYQLNLKPIFHPEQGYLIKKYNLVRLNSTRKLATGVSQPSYDSITLFGGVRYAYQGDTTSKQQKNQSALAMKDLPGYEQTRSMKGSFHFLKGSLQEVRTISQFVEKAANTKVKTGYNATETSFKKLDGNSPNVLHIATHGFFFPDNPDSVYNNKGRTGVSSFRYLQDPLFRSGLAFAGSNYTWQHGSNPYEEQDGILTAKEISHMNLSNTDIVVLSACETGLGEIKGSEGVYGLQRAFKKAGVDYLIMSLWNVPDKQTMRLMRWFYENWLDGTPVRQAFQHAQGKLAERFPPYYWASFVLLGGGHVQDKQETIAGEFISYPYLIIGIGIITMIGLLMLIKARWPTIFASRSN